MCFLAYTRINLGTLIDPRDTSHPIPFQSGRCDATADHCPQMQPPARSNTYSRRADTHTCSQPVSHPQAIEYQCGLQVHAVSVPESQAPCLVSVSDFGSFQILVSYQLTSLTLFASKVHPQPHTIAREVTQKIEIKPNEKIEQIRHRVWSEPAYMQLDPFSLLPIFPRLFFPYLC